MSGDVTQEEIQAERNAAAKEIFGDESLAGIVPATEAEPSSDEQVPGEAGKEVQGQEGQAAAGQEGAGDPPPGGEPSIADVLAELSKTTAALGTMESRLKQSEQRLGAMSNSYYSDRKKAEEAAAKQAAQPTAEDIAAEKKAQEEWEALKKDDPEIADAVEGRVAMIEKKFNQVVPATEKLNKATEALQAVDQLQKQVFTKEDLQRELVAFVHPNWEKTIASKEYHAWLPKQPEAIQKLAKTSALAKDAVYVLNQFTKAQLAKKSPEDIKAAREQRLQIAESEGGSKKIPREKLDSELTLQEIRDEEAKKIWKDL